MQKYHSHNLKATGGTPANRVLTACQKMKILAGFADLQCYVMQITMALAYMEANR